MTTCDFSLEVGAITQLATKRHQAKLSRFQRDKKEGPRQKKQAKQRWLWGPVARLDVVVLTSFRV